MPTPNDPSNHARRRIDRHAKPHDRERRMSAPCGAEDEPRVADHGEEERQKRDRRRDQRRGSDVRRTVSSEAAMPRRSTSCTCGLRNDDVTTGSTPHPRAPGEVQKWPAELLSPSDLHLRSCREKHLRAAIDAAMTRGSFKDRMVAQAQQRIDTGRQWLGKDDSTEAYAMNHVRMNGFDESCVMRTVDRSAGAHQAEPS